MAPLPDIECDFADAPLMLALAQITFTQSPEVLQSITEIKGRLCEIDLPVADIKQKMRVSVSFGSTPPKVGQDTFWWFASLDTRRAVAISSTSIVIYDASYRRFDDFSKLTTDVVESVVKVAGNGCFLTTASLRYVSGFSCEELPSPFLVAGLRGIPTDNFQTDHFHHAYNYWCSTAPDCRLFINSKTVHGNELIPKDVLAVGVGIDGKFRLPRETDAVQLEIYETMQKKKLEKLDPCAVKVLFREMHQRIKTAFLTATTSLAHDKWQIR